jgi:RNA polymerase sigma-70 factor (ECF subfamily)
MISEGCDSKLPLEEEILVKKSKNGDFEAFEELVNLHEKHVYNIAWNMLRNQEDAEEVLQETFIKAYDKLNQFEGRSKFSTWLYRIATNEALMILRKRNPLQPVSLDEPIDDGYRTKIRRELIDWRENPQDIYLKKELKEKIDYIIFTLPEDYRSVFVLRDIQGFSGEKVSEILSITLPAVKARLHRARLYAREILNNYFKERR